MTEPIPNRITKDGRTWERISGPWSIAEMTTMIKDITRFERSGIKCITETYHGDTWVYRDARGYIDPDSSRIMTKKCLKEDKENA